MPKEDPEEDNPKKKSPHDDEDEEFDKEIEESMDDEVEEPAKKGKPSNEVEEDPLDNEDDDELDPDLLKAGSSEVFGEEDQEEDKKPQEDLTPKPTFRYNAPPPPPPSEEPTIIPPGDEHTLDDLSEEDLNQRPARPFQVDRGVPAEDAPPVYPRPQAPQQMEAEAFEDDPRLHIPPIRKQNNFYAPHQVPRNGGYEDQEFDEPRAQAPRQPNPYNPYAPDPNQRMGGFNQRPQKQGASKWHIIALLLIGGGVIAATVYLLQNQFNFPGKPVAETPAPSAVVTEATPVPTPTPAPITKADFKVRVLNGTTKAGLAKQVLDKLKEQGYQTDKAGNAPKQDYEQTVIRVKEGDATLSAQLTKDLAPDYNASIQPDLKKDDSVDAEIILGQK
jgi:hypothetical protein